MAKQINVIEVHEKLVAVELSTVPVMSTDRHISRKEQAALTRKLFRQLGVKGISVTAPAYSMAKSVDVQVPRRDGYTGVIDADRDSNNAAVAKVAAILSKAFPNHDDRSDTQSDYYDFKWSIALVGYEATAF